MGNNLRETMRRANNELRVRSEDERSNPPANFATDRVHEVTIFINMQGSRKTVRVVITEQGTTIFNSPSLGLLNADFSILHTVQIESETGINYFVQDLIAVTTQ